MKSANCQKPQIEIELSRIIAGGFIAPCRSEHISNLVIVRRGTKSGYAQTSILLAVLTGS
jgi:hypothetical protein